MNGYARVKLTTDKLLVRFERIAPADAFDRIRDEFYQRVPSAIWNQRIRWMEVTRADEGRVLEFCYTRFGPGRVYLMQEGSTTTQAAQLSFRL